MMWLRPKKALEPLRVWAARKTGLMVSRLVGSASKAERAEVYSSMSSLLSVMKS